jgi:hypothetical protein
MTVYQVGALKYPEVGDPEFEADHDAEIAAIEMSLDDDVYGVWDKENGELISIVYQQQVFYG